MKLARQGYTLIFPAFAIFDLTLIWYILSGRDIPLYLAIASGLLALFFVFFFFVIPNAMYHPARKRLFPPPMAA